MRFESLAQRRQAKPMVAQECAVSVVPRIALTYLHVPYTFSILMLILVIVIVHQVCCTQMQIAMERINNGLFFNLIFLCLSRNPDVIETKNQHSLHSQCLFIRFFHLKLLCI